MKKLALVALVLLMAATTAFADITFYNQPWDGNSTGRCDNNTPSCGDTGFTVYDNFTIASGIATITQFTYVSGIGPGSWAGYTGTDWTLFGPNSSDPFGTAAYSGTAVGTVTDLGNGHVMISVTGLSIPVIAGQSWIFGFSNNLLDPNAVTGRDSSGIGDGIFWQQDNSKDFQYIGSGDTAFSVSGTPTPEPSALIMLGTGLLGAVGVLRRKVKV